jgi:hypothetical protein
MHFMWLFQYMYCLGRHKALVTSATDMHTFQAGLEQKKCLVDSKDIV